MFEDYINHVFKNLKYEVDEDGVIIAKATGYDGYYSQGATYEEARDNLVDAIQGIVLLKLELGDKEMINELRKFTLHHEHQYA